MQENIVMLVITMQATSGGGHIYIDGKLAYGQSGTIKYPLESGSHQGSFTMSGMPGENYSIIVIIENGPTLWETHGTLSIQGVAAGQKVFQV